MIKCYKCGNTTNFAEVYVGGYRRHEWTQESNGRFIFEGSNFDKADDIWFKCSKCNADLNEQHRKFLQALFEPYNEEKSGI